MQVSWIDADRLKALVAQIAPEMPCPDDLPQPVEIETVPDSAPGSLFGAWEPSQAWMQPEENQQPAEYETHEVSMADELMPGEAEQGETEDEEEAEERGLPEPLPNPGAALPLSRIRDKLRAIRQRAAEAGILVRGSDVTVPESAVQAGPVAAVGVSAPESPASGSPVDFEIPKGSREERLGAFARWARRLLREDGGHILVMTDDGEVLWGGEAKAGLVLSTMMAWGAAVRASATTACGEPAIIRQPLASGNVLTVIPCGTEHGMLHAAVAAPAGLNDELSQLLRGALCAAMASGY